MKLKSSILLVAFVCISVVVISTTVMNTAKSWIDYNLYQRMYIENTAELKKSVAGYHRDKKELPTKIQDLIDGGYLKPNDIFYRSYLKNRSIPDKPIHYSKIEYTVIFDYKKSGECYAIFPKSHLDSYWISEGRKSRPLKIRIF